MGPPFPIHSHHKAEPLAHGDFVAPLDGANMDEKKSPDSPSGLMKPYASSGFHFTTVPTFHMV